ncbi:hypothetical protein [Klebsiella michiganensis]|uniref:hypothetical protein n=1 Tax=Klebsiella michiganensis TaxID=1134687 RepID=UPI0020178A4A|nr:hypothetical protein [Klebsiella michiganensis]
MRDLILQLSKSSIYSTKPLGVKDSALPANEAEVWNNTHTATLEDYKLGNSETLLYTPEALKAAEEQELRGLK